MHHLNLPDYHYYSELHWLPIVSPVHSEESELPCEKAEGCGMIVILCAAAKVYTQVRSRRGATTMLTRAGKVRLRAMPLVGANDYTLAFRSRHSPSTRQETNGASKLDLPVVVVAPDGGEERLASRMWSCDCRAGFNVIEQAPPAPIRRPLCPQPASANDSHVADDALERFLSTNNRHRRCVMA